MSATCAQLSVSPLQVIVPGLSALALVAWWTEQREKARQEVLLSSPVGLRYVKALERIAAAPRSTRRSSPRSGARKPTGRGR